MVTITLKDGTKLENIELNGDVFVSHSTLEKSVFDDNLENVIIDVDGESTSYERMRLVNFRENSDDPDLYDFVLKPLTDFDIKEDKGLSYLASLLLTDEQAVKAAFLFDEWDPNGIKYRVDDKVQYNDLLYKCLQAHTSQASWDPVSAVSLWVRIDNPAEEWPEWRQPTGAHDAYSKGYKVSHNGKHWTSDVDNNTWEPGSYGWTEVVEE